MLTAALFDEEDVTGFAGEPGMETPRQNFPGGAFVIMAVV